MLNLTFPCSIKAKKLFYELRIKVEILNNSELLACSQLYSEYFEENGNSIENQHLNVEPKLKS